MPRTMTLTTRGRVTIPRDIRKQLGSEPRDRVVFTVEGDHAVLRRAASSLESVRGIAAGRIPLMTIQDERDAFEQGVADEVMSETEQ